MSIHSIKSLPDAIFWDWDGTIADSYGFLNDAHNHTLLKLGFEAFVDGEYKQYFGKPREILYPAIYKDKSDQALEIFQDFVLKNSHNINLLDGARNVIDYLTEQDILMGIVSNKKSSFIREELKHLKWDGVFQTVVGSKDAAADKPSSAPLNYAMQLCDIDKAVHNVWYIGDTENDLACAQEAGCAMLFLTGVDNTAELIEKYNPDFCFDSHVQLKEFLVAL